MLDVCVAGVAGVVLRGVIRRLRGNDPGHGTNGTGGDTNGGAVDMNDNVGWS
jgi:hypothetical protein